MSLPGRAPSPLGRALVVLLLSTATGLAGAASCTDDGATSGDPCSAEGKTLCTTICVRPNPFVGQHCDSVCKNLATDSANCGRCGLECPSAQVCVAGGCTLQCPEGDIACPDGDGGPARCVNAVSDNQNCGACGQACGVGEICQLAWLGGSGVCGPNCMSGWALCTVDGGAPFCADIATDNENCGKCGVTCPTDSICRKGACSSCSAMGKVFSTGCPRDGGPPICVEVQSDDANCGKCGVACHALERCIRGSCVSQCTESQRSCVTDGGAPFCADIRSDNRNCGACGNACPWSTPVCNDGSCQ